MCLASFAQTSYNHMPSGHPQCWALLRPSALACCGIENLNQKNMSHPPDLPLPRRKLHLHPSMVTCLLWTHHLTGSCLGPPRLSLNLLVAEYKCWAVGFAVLSPSSDNIHSNADKKISCRFLQPASSWDLVLVAHCQQTQFRDHIYGK